MADIPKLRRTLQALQTDRRQIEPAWDSIERYIMPLTGKTVEARNPAIPTTGIADTEAWDFTAVSANEHLAAHLAANVIPASARWFGMEFLDPELRVDKDALAYLEKITEAVWLEIRNSDFASEMGSALLEYCAKGNLIITCEAAAKTGWEGIDFTAVPVNEGFFVEDYRGRVIEFFQVMKWTSLKTLDFFGSDKVPDSIREAVAAGGERMLEEHLVVFAVWKRLDYSEARDDKGEPLPMDPLKREFGSVHFLHDTGEQLGDEGGYYEMPTKVGRWARRAGLAWGFGRGNVVLRSIRYLNLALEVDRLAREKALDPSYITTQRGLMSNPNNKPGGVTVVGDMDHFKVNESGVHFDVSTELIRDVRMEVRRVFHEDDLQLKESPAMTATEVQARRDLMDRSLGAPVGRLQKDVLEPIVHQVLRLLWRAGKLPKAPPAVRAKKAEAAVSFFGAIARAQRVDEVASIERLFSFGAGLAKSDPDHAEEIWSALDRVQALREAALRLGTPAKVLKSEAEVLADQKARAAADQADRQAQLALTRGQAAKASADARGAPAPAPDPSAGPGGLPLGLAPQAALSPSTGQPF